ncbi:MAG: PIN domain-containing protein [Euryarchaeota archaeon]|nr:PIN domain-containing protein [Euryarchaeota archaeon]MDE1836012.1 PIN domain-containing protein [Euryarchaeota archaeon]MDE1881607.1 PIN domain-containing protein [Euryarchaeota archaeon]MDE2045996.1 PIN domain-containing protein [Thermoplasmata archaeon]
MIGSRVAFDTWAWWEVLKGSEIGVDLQRRYLSRDGARAVTSVITLAELSAKLADQGSEHAIAPMSASLHHRGEIIELTEGIALSAGTLRKELRKAHRSASLADAIILSTSRKAGAKLISVDPAFRGQRDVSPR